MIDKDIKILIADDVPVMRRLILHLLEQLELENVDMVANGAKALDMLRKYKYDVVLSDWKMPVMDGLELLRAMKSDPALKDIPVILITAEDSEERILNAIEEGVNNYIVKPLSVKTLEDKLIKVLKKR